MVTTEVIAMNIIRAKNAQYNLNSPVCDATEKTTLGHSSVSLFCFGWM
jgi:hypothetical protein